MPIFIAPMIYEGVNVYLPLLHLLSGPSKLIIVAIVFVIAGVIVVAITATIIASAFASSIAASVFELDRQQLSLRLHFLCFLVFTGCRHLFFDLLEEAFDRPCSYSWVAAVIEAGNTLQGGNFGGDIP
jgi:hypothetical protein